MKPIVTTLIFIGVFLVSVIGQNQPNRCCNSIHPPRECDEIQIDSKTLIKHRISCVEPKINSNDRYRSAVVAKVIVNRDGFVDCAIIYRGLPDEINDAIIEAVKKWRFKPFKVKNQPVAVTSLVAVAITGSNTSNQCTNNEKQ